MNHSRRWIVTRRDGSRPIPSMGVNRDCAVTPEPNIPLGRYETAPMWRRIGICASGTLTRTRNALAHRAVRIRGARW